MVFLIPKIIIFKQNDDFVLKITFRADGFSQKVGKKWSNLTKFDHFNPI